jgi:hypothetical protein
MTTIQTGKAKEFSLATYLIYLYIRNINKTPKFPSHLIAIVIATQSPLWITIKVVVTQIGNIFGLHLTHADTPFVLRLQGDF